MSDERVAYVLRDFVVMCRGAIEKAVLDSPEVAIDMLAEYFDEAGVEDADTRKILDKWWSQRKGKDNVDPNAPSAN